MNTIFTVIIGVGFALAVFGVVVSSPVIAVFGGFTAMAAGLARDEPPRD